MDNAYSVQLCFCKNNLIGITLKYVKNQDYLLSVKLKINLSVVYWVDLSKI
jgi:hypothetical protein